MNRESLRARIARAAILLATAVLAAACDSGPQAVRTGGTGSPKSTIASGPITGLGSIVVNGVRFDETSAEVTINGAANRPVSELALGMVVEVRGEVDEGSRTGKASTVVATAILAGPVAATGGAAGEITVLGQRVEIFADTVLQGASSPAGVRTGDAVVVYGFWDYFAGHVDATRLEVVPAAAAPPATIIGKIGAVTGTRFQVGALVVETAAAVLTGLEGGIATGRYVEAKGALDAAGILRAATVAARSEFNPVEGVQTEIEGYVTDFAGLASFRVLGVPVNGAAARIEGASAGVANGALVEVEGRIERGILVASLVEVKASALQQPAPEPVTLSGVVTDFVSLASFRVRDQAVDATSAVFSGGTAANLANGRNVEVSGVMAGNLLRASSVTFTDPPVPEGTRTTVSGAIEFFASPTSFRVNGQAVTTTMGTVYAGGTVADLANGRRVDVDGMLSAGILTAWTITFPPTPVVTTVSLAGVISDFVSPANFRVNNQAIATDASTVFEEGTAADLANGRRVEIEGRLAAGVVTATKVHFDDPPTPVEDAEVEGSITSFVSVSNFKVKGQVVDASAARFTNGGPADLANGLRVHAKGPVKQGVLRAKALVIDR